MSAEPALWRRLLLHLLFAPTDDPAAGTGVAEPPAPTDLPTDPPTEPPQPTEPELAEEQEPTDAPVPRSTESGDEGAEVESGAPEPDEGEPSVAERLESTFAKIAEEHPELLDAAIDKLPEEMQEKYRGSEGERAKNEAVAAQTVRATAVKAAYQADRPYAQQVNANDWESWAKDTVTEVKEKLAKAVEAGDANVELLTADFVQDIAGLAQYATHGRTTQQAYLGTLAHHGIMERLENGPIHRFLSTDDREKLKSANYLDALDIYQQAGLAASPKAVKEEARADVEKELGMAKVLKELEGVLGEDGRKATRGDAPSKAQTFEELETLYAAGEATDAQVAQYKKLRRERGYD